MFEGPTVLICSLWSNLKIVIQTKIGSQIDAMLDKANGNSHETSIRKRY